MTSAARLATQIEDARNAARSIFGDRYDEKVEPWRVFVRALASEWKCSPLQVAPELERRGEVSENPLLLIAASADVVEERARADSH